MPEIGLSVVCRDLIPGYLPMKTHQQCRWVFREGGFGPNPQLGRPESPHNGPGGFDRGWGRLNFWKGPSEA